MKNRYEGHCDKCRKKVKRMEGEAIKRQGTWFVRCGSCVKIKNIEDELLQRALTARNDMGKNLERVESYDSSQMNLKFERSRHVGDDRK